VVIGGLAGSAAVALLVLATIPSPPWGVLDLLIFGPGTICRHDAYHRGQRRPLRLYRTTGRMGEPPIRKAVLNCEQLDRR